MCATNCTRTGWHASGTHQPARPAASIHRTNTPRSWPPKEVLAPEHVVAALGLDVGATAVRRQRLTFADDQPMEVSTSWYPAAVAVHAPLLLVRERIRLGTLVYVEQTTGRQARYARDEMSARLATDQEREYLHLDSPAAVLLVNHVVYDGDDRPLEYAEAVFPPGRWASDTTYPVA
jgi:DNA-binding GntR family transcriptional regulator